MVEKKREALPKPGETDFAAAEWYRCPTCGKRIQKLAPDSVIYGTPLRCRMCKVDWYPTIYMGKELDEHEPLIHER